LTRRADFAKGWRRPFFDHHIRNILRALERRLDTKRGTHDQYATIGENWDVIEKEMFTKKRESLPNGRLMIEICNLLILNGGQRRDRTADAGLFRAA
jgi:hypothetical protein